MVTKQSKRQGLRSRMVAVALALGAASAGPAQAFTVHDPGNALTHVAAALEQVDQGLDRVDDFKKLNEDAMKHSFAPGVYYWDQTQQVMQSLRSANGAVSALRDRFGLSGYLAKFRDLDYYRSSSCYGPTGCSGAERAAMADQQALGYESQKRANDAVVHLLWEQEQALTQDANQLARLQGYTESAPGRMAALQYTNQMLSHQAHILQQLRALLMAQLQMLQASQQAELDEKARQQAARERFYRVSNTTSSPRAWRE